MKFQPFQQGKNVWLCSRWNPLRNNPALTWWKLVRWVVQVSGKAPSRHLRLPRIRIWGARNSKFKQYVLLPGTKFSVVGPWVPRRAPKNVDLAMLLFQVGILARFKLIRPESSARLIGLRNSILTFKNKFILIWNLDLRVAITLHIQTIRATSKIFPRFTSGFNKWLILASHSC